MTVGNTWCNNRRKMRTEWKEMWPGGFLNRSTITLVHLRVCRCLVVTFSDTCLLCRLWPQRVTWWRNSILTGIRRDAFAPRMNWYGNITIHCTNNVSAQASIQTVSSLLTTATATLQRPSYPHVALLLYGPTIDQGRLWPWWQAPALVIHMKITTIPRLSKILSIPTMVRCLYLEHRHCTNQGSYSGYKWPRWSSTDKFRQSPIDRKYTIVIVTKPASTIIS